MPKTITFQEFLAGHKNGDFTIAVNKSKAGDFVLSPHANKYNKPAHLFWSWLGLILFLPLALVLLFLDWKYALISFILGIFITQGAQKSTARFVAENMLESEDFWDYTLLHHGAKILDKDGNELMSTFLKKMADS